ncbi:ribonuclease P protein component [Motilibacter aurantiacus]|uniref:ribonuclease P protein component n=1 Tax=Motilibacter aurantiacus TaxID=2714955 RepID=UPI00140BC995|nr:ribonuclease P protein component [Motilibacter aurantiacus]
MLPAAARLRSRSDFALALRRGPGSGRGASRCVVVHVRLPDAETAAAGPADASRAVEHPSQPTSDALVGFAVSKAVGNAVVRNGVRRRLRALVRDRLETLPQGSRVVVRALPAAAAVRFSVLAEELDRALGQAIRSAGRPARSVT